MVSPFLAALKGCNFASPPVWLMRQAGRYMPSYRALRQKNTFLEMVHNSELAAKVTLMPIEQFHFDAAILFSDILLLVETLGVGLHFCENIGPIIEKPLKKTSDIFSLPLPSVAEQLAFVAEAIRIVKPQLKVPLIGFCGAPFTLASYLIEGKSSRDLATTKRWLLNEPESFHFLLKRLTELTIAYIDLQIKAGAEAIQIFDSWAGVLSHKHFKEFSLHYLTILSDAVKAKNIPVILFCRGSSLFAQQLADVGPTALSLDWLADISEIRKTVGPAISLQGNLDPLVLLASKKVIGEESRIILRSMKGDPAFIFNLGHGVLPDTPYENVQALVDIVKSA